MLTANNMDGTMDNNFLGRRIKMVRNNRGFTADKLSELCNINESYLMQIEGGKKTPSLPVFIDICNALQISPDYLLQDILVDNEISGINKITELWKTVSLNQQEVITAMIEAALETMRKTNS